MTGDDSEFTPDDRARRQRLSRFMFDRGFTRDARGFWVQPGFGVEAAAAQEFVDDDGEAQ